jgi:hypothetical protein
VCLQDLQFIVAEHRYDAIDPRVLGRARPRPRRPHRLFFFRTVFFLEVFFLTAISCTHALRVAAVRATGTDPFSTSGPLFVTIVLDFLATESPKPWKNWTFHANTRENPTHLGVYSPERTLIARSSAIPAEKDAKWSTLTPR